jgi:undecaprenyl-diphosphatase
MMTTTSVTDITAMAGSSVFGAIRPGDLMESLNQTFFLWLNAPEHPNALTLTLAMFFAEQLIWAVPILMGVGWLRGSKDTRETMLIATASGLLGLLINQVIGLAWPHPRPFMIGLGHTLIPHVADSSFPSDHLTLWWAIAFSLALRRGPRTAGVALVLLGVPIAWARIYLGVHFPLDMLGAGAVAVFSAWLTARGAHSYLELTYRLATNIHRRFFGSLIARGWVRE